MLQAKANDINNFRVINKQEFIEIFKEETTKEHIGADHVIATNR